MIKSCAHSENETSQPSQDQEYDAQCSTIRLVITPCFSGGCLLRACEPPDQEKGLSKYPGMVHPTLTYIQGHFHRKGFNPATGFPMATFFCFGR